MGYERPSQNVYIIITKTFKNLILIQSLYIADCVLTEHSFINALLHCIGMNMKIELGTR